MEKAGVSATSGGMLRLAQTSVLASEGLMGDEGFGSL